MCVPPLQSTLLAEYAAMLGERLVALPHGDYDVSEHERMLELLKVSGIDMHS